MKHPNDPQSSPQLAVEDVPKHPVSIYVIFLGIVIEFLLFGFSTLKEYAIVGHLIPPTVAIFGFLMLKLDSGTYFSLYGVLATYGCFAFDVLKVTGEDASVILHGVDIGIQILLLVLVGYYLVLTRIQHQGKEITENAILACIIVTFLVPQAEDPGTVSTLALLLMIVSWNTQLLFLIADPNITLSPKSAAILSLPLMRLHHILLIAAFAVVFALQTVKIYTLFNTIQPQDDSPRKPKEPFLETADLESFELPPSAEPPKQEPKQLSIQTRAPPVQKPPQPPPPPKPKKLTESYSYISQPVPPKPKTPVPDFASAPPPPQKMQKVAFSAYAS